MEYLIPWLFFAFIAAAIAGALKPTWRIKAESLRELPLKVLEEKFKEWDWN